MLHKWPLRTSGTCEGSGDTCLHLSKDCGRSEPCSRYAVLLISSVLPWHHRAAASSETWGLQVVRVSSQLLPWPPALHCPAFLR